MGNQTYNCSKCDGRMIRGFITDLSNNAYFPVHWVEGEPVFKTLFGLQAANLDVAGRDMYILRSLKCEKCGFLDLYAV